MTTHDVTIDLPNRLEHAEGIRLTLPDGRLVLSVDSDGLLRLGDEILPAEFADAVRGAFLNGPRSDETLERVLANLRALGIDDPAAWLEKAATLAHAGATPRQLDGLVKIIACGRVTREDAVQLGIGLPSGISAARLEDEVADAKIDERNRITRELYRMAADTPGLPAHTLARAALALSGVRTS